MGELLRSKPAGRNFKTLFGVEAVPHGDTLGKLAARLDPDQLQECMCALVERLIRNKILYPYRLLDRWFVIVVDGTGILSFPRRHCPHCLTRTRNGKTIYYHYVLEAKLVTINGFAFSIMTEFVENPGTDPPKQDCELKAFYRLAERLKARFPRLPICLSLDGLYAGGPTFKLCQNLEWKFIITLKDDDLPAVNAEFEALGNLQSENQTQIRNLAANTIQDYRWVNGISYQDSKRRIHQVDVLELRQSAQEKNGGRAAKFKWITNFNLTAQNVARIAEQGGRIRWKIENEGFNVQKNGGYGLEHAYAQKWSAAKNFYFLLQIAHALFQLMWKGSLLKKIFPQGVGSEKNLAFLLLEAWRNAPFNPERLAALLASKFQIRLDSS